MRSDAVYTIPLSATDAILARHRRQFDLVLKLLIFYLPGNVYADFQIDRFSDEGVCVFLEIAILFGTPFVPFFLIYLAIRKSASLFFSDDSAARAMIEI